MLTERILFQNRSLAFFGHCVTLMDGSPEKWMLCVQQAAVHDIASSPARCWETPPERFPNLDLVWQSHVPETRPPDKLHRQGHCAAALTDALVAVDGRAPGCTERRSGS